MTDAFPEPDWEPGVVEVVWKQAIAPESLLGVVNPPLHAHPPDKTLAPDLVNTLVRNGLEDAVYSFEDLEDVEPLVDENTDNYSRKNYLTLYFAKDRDVVKIAQELEQSDRVAYAVPIPIAIPPSSPLNEPETGEHTEQIVIDPPNQWYIFRCRADRAWINLDVSGAGVVIADIDFGFLDTHEDLSSRIERKYNSYDKSDKVCQGDSFSHGTAVLGIAGAADNDLGIIGFAFGASLWAIQANTGKGPKPKRNPWALAIEYVRTTSSGGRRKIIILEVQTSAFRNYEMVPSVNKAIRDAIKTGIVVCVAAGNGNRDVSIGDNKKPIFKTGSILVGATEDVFPNRNKRACFSNYGKQIAVSAPGEISHDLTCSIFSDPKYTPNFGGTSGATPKVAGTIALMLEKNPTLSHNDVKNILMATGTEIITEPDKLVGRFLDVEAAVKEAIRRASRPLLLRLGLALLRLVTRRAR
jgi:subtilisin family serine protease